MKSKDNKKITEIPEIYVENSGENKLINVKAPLGFAVDIPEYLREKQLMEKKLMIKVVYKVLEASHQV